MTLTDPRRDLQTLAAKLQAAMQFQQMYPSRHPQVVQAVADCFAEVRGLLIDAGKLQVALADKEFVLGTKQIPAEGELLAAFAETLQRVGVQRLVLHQGLHQWELQEFLRILALSPEELAAGGGLEHLMQDRGITGIEAGVIRFNENDNETADSLFRTWEAYTIGLNMVRGLRLRARDTGRVDNAEDARQFAYELVELALQETKPLLAVHALKAHDEYSFTHSVNVAMLSTAMAYSLGLEREDVHEIAVAALLHDVGKERVPAAILQKPGKLNADEWEVIERHGLEGARMLVSAPGAGDLAPIVAFEHHLAYEAEKRGDSTWRPHFASALVSLADVYDALRSVRPYRGEIAPHEAMAIMEEDVGRKFDPDLFEGFRRMLGYFPPGTVVRLKSGALAVVSTPNPHAEREPKVIVVRDSQQRPLEPPELLNLADRRRVADEIVDVVNEREIGVDPLEVL